MTDLLATQQQHYRATQPPKLKQLRDRLDQWRKQIAPSIELRAWFAHGPQRFAVFSRRYRAELAEPDRAGGARSPAVSRSGRRLDVGRGDRARRDREAAVLADLLRR